MLITESAFASVAALVSDGTYVDLPRSFVADSQWDNLAKIPRVPAPYLAFALRTDAPNTDSYRRVSELFEYLPRHPIAKRIRIVDPLSCEVESLAGPRPFEWPEATVSARFQ